ncbi:hypothetical protein [Penaeicola halotolerans]|uniref:hypothetical protein n=1 Tax=Penaeicola halotolerans TaxID=2793196 RepID=UPI001CF8D668|nr:hypothetical protein [Penaeicola halotolerans]
MRKIEIWLNILHYCIFKTDKKLHILFNKINPFTLIGKIPAVKRKFEEKGTTYLNVVNKVWTDERFGFGIIISGCGIVIISSFLIWGLSSTFFGLLEVRFLVKPIHVLVYGLISFLVCYMLVFRHDKYIKYFKKLDKLSTNEKWKFALISFLFVVSCISLWIYSFRFSVGKI